MLMGNGRAISRTAETTIFLRKSDIASEIAFYFALKNAVDREIFRVSYIIDDDLRYLLAAAHVRHDLGYSEDVATLTISVLTYSSSTGNG